MKIKLVSSLIIFLICSGCVKKWQPIAVDGQTFETSYGTVTQLDVYPLYKLKYETDYQFDEYLQTGQIPSFANNDFSSHNFSCTCFSAFGDKNRLLGRNYDWNEKSSYYLLFTNPPNGYSSVSTVDLSFFNYNHDLPPSHSDNQKVLRTLPFFPFDGMNEKGVAIGMNALNSASAPYDPLKVSIGELQVIRLVLDYASSTNEAISLIQQYNVRMENPPIHYLIADSSGHSAVIEFVNGEMVVLHNSEPWQVTTNFVINGLTDPHIAPCWRYRTAYLELEQKTGILSEDNVFNLLQTVSVSITRWSSVYNLRSNDFQISVGRNFKESISFSIAE